ncbi:archease [Myxococcota bacterium]|nr:archease [Myxococcota bacterium]MBU1430061.1 archease [Myxococcota bacterium]MBU1896298.1 archease [Myxococcota bacterium]
MSRGFKSIEHTADLALALWAEDEAGIFEVAAEAITDNLTEGATLGAEARQRVTLRGLDHEDLLVRWINEILLLAILDGFLTRRASVRLLPEAALEATLWGEAEASARVVAELKSATYHHLELAPTPEGWRAQVIIDV